jgi:polyhydroxyalkanoate synthesis regulator phasin
VLSGSRDTFLSIKRFITHKSITRVVDLSKGTGDIHMSTKKKVAAIVVTTVALTAGTVGISSAASKTTKTTRVSITKTAGASVRGPQAEVASVLAALVTKGTITQAQADAIKAALDAAEIAEHANDPAGMGKGFGPDRAAQLTLIAQTLGITEAALKTRLDAGDSLATIAGDKKAALITALVAAETKSIDDAVTAGKLTAAKATELKAGLTAHVTDEVNSTRPAGGPMGGKGGKGGRGHGPMGGTPGTTSGTTALTLPATPAA